MKIRVKFYARYGDKFGKEHYIDIESSISVENFLKLLYKVIPGLQNERNIIMAINDSLASADYILKDGDSVSIFPPPGGG